MKSRITVKCLIWRIIFCFAGQFLCGCAIGLSVNADLGVMPGSSLAYACSLVWGMDLGLWAFILFVLMLLAQVMMLRKD